MRRESSFALALALALALLAGACSGSTGAPDSGIDAGPREGSCDVGTTPDPLPQIAGSFAIAEGDGGLAIPVPAGGDPEGLWVFDRATFYVSAAAAAMFDLEASTIEGSAWMNITATEFALDWRFVTTLMGTVAGTIVRPSSTQIRASYTLDGATFIADPICAQSNAVMAPRDGGTAGTSMLEFTRMGDSITVVSRLSGAAGTITIVLEGTRRTTP